MDLITDLSPLSPGLMDDLEAFMGPVGEGCYPPQPDARRVGVHQLPESPPDSGSENPYSPSEVPHAVTVSQTVLPTHYTLVHEHIPPSEIMTSNGEYIYEQLKSDSIDHEFLRNNVDEVVVLSQDPSIVDLGLRAARNDMGLADQIYQNRYAQMRVDLPELELEQSMINHQLVSLGHENLTPVYTNLQEPICKKRKHDQDVKQLKCEPAALSPDSMPHLRGAPSVDGSEAGDDAPLQCIKFQSFQQSAWHELYDCNLKPLPAISYVVGADKGFNYSQIDEAFVCQKKNHFQVTCQVQAQGDPQYVKTNEGFNKINSFYLHFYGVKAEDPSHEVRIEQSQSDRTKKPFHPVAVDIRREGSKVTVGRLHFAETTNNNMRKKGRPNPDQRHFQLVVGLRAHTHRGECPIAASASDRIIVRASNPGQFESDCSESWWQRGVSDNSVHYNGRVGINTDRPDESCVINGNLKVMGHIVHPSDSRAKHDIEELDTAQQLKNVQGIRIVKFNYDPSFAQHSGLLGFDPSCSAPRADTGVIAQEVRKVIPEAVKEAGDVTLPNGRSIDKFLVVNKDRIFMENLGAVKELCKVTGNLESRIDQLEKINKKLCKMSILQRKDSARSSISNDSRHSAVSASSKSLYSDGNISIDQIRDIARNIRKHECCHKLSHNSPKYTRKQCKNCHNTYAKYAKYYNYNKTWVRYHNGKVDKSTNHECLPSYVDTLDSNAIEKMPDDNFGSIDKKKDSRLWLRSDDNFVYGNTLPFCCRKRDKYSDAGSELISNKFLQIVITVLIFIMAVCLVVMSALYFREHQELMSMKETRLQEKFATYGHYGKLNVDGMTYRGSPTDRNQIQNLKPSQHATSKKATKEKASHKSTVNFTTLSHTESLTTATVSEKMHITLMPHLEPTSNLPLATQSLNRKADVIGRCPYTLNSDNELDAECQSSCVLDAPQTYENQEPLDRSKPDKEVNDTFARPLEKPQIPPIIPEKNNTDNIKNDNDSLTSHDEVVDESNLLDKQNATDANGRLKRGVQGHKNIINDVISNGKDLDSAVQTLRQHMDGLNAFETLNPSLDGFNPAVDGMNTVIDGTNKVEYSLRRKRETNEALRSSEEMNLSEQIDCDKIVLGLSSKNVMNESIFTETLCGQMIYNFSYTVPLSPCLNYQHIDIFFRSSKLKEIRLCDFHCKYDTAKNCQVNREMAKPVPTGESWTSKMTLECNMDRVMKVRAGYNPQKDLCYLSSDSKTPFVEYNIHIFRDTHCHN